MMQKNLKKFQEEIFQILYTILCLCVYVDYVCVCVSSQTTISGNEKKNVRKKRKIMFNGLVNFIMIVKVEKYFLFCKILYIKFIYHETNEGLKGKE